MAKKVILIVALGFLLAPTLTNAANDRPAIILPIPEIRIPVKFSDITIDENCEAADAEGVYGCYNIPWIGEYIAGMYVWAVAAATILAAIVLMIAGFIWLTSGGNVTQISTAKSYASGAILGLLLMLGSYIILRIINPSLVRFDALKIPIVDELDPIPSQPQECSWQGRCNQDYPNVATTDKCEAQPQPSPFAPCCCKNIMSYKNNTVASQAGDAAPELTALLDCIRKKTSFTVTEISDENLRNGKCKPWKTDANNFENQTSACTHHQGSMHYRGFDGIRNNEDNLGQAVIARGGFSCAADLRTQGIGAVPMSKLEEYTTKCGGDTLAEGNHLHIASPNCNGGSLF